MVRGFVNKRIKPKGTLGALLKQARRKKKVSLLEAENLTKVRAKYLEAIERSGWGDLPQKVYTRGFVLAYAKFLGVPSHQAISLFEKETKTLGSANETNISYKQKLKDHKILITPKVLAYSSLTIFVIFLLGFVLMQLLNFASTPNIQITSINNNSIVDSESIDLIGVTDTDTKVEVNNESVPVSSDGKFQIKLRLHRGLNVIKVVAINKIKKETSHVYTLEYKPKTASADPSQINQ